MNFQYIKPSKFLSQYIKHYWVLEADDSEGEVCERVIPTGIIEWMFHYGNTFVVRNSEEEKLQPRSFVSGINSNYTDVFTRGESGVIAVTFYPHGASHFLPFPLSEIENVSIDLGDIFNAAIMDIEDEISAANSVMERIGIIERFLLSRFQPIKNNDLLLIKESIKLINQSKGQIFASDLSKRLFLTNKSLERKFSTFLGKSPKQYIRIVRFQSTIESLSNINNRQLTEFAYENGYFDQSHFIRDFKTLSGYTPKEFLSLGPCHADYFQ